jgi:DNA repair exonuclease SbcCD ATPase subunit
MNTRDAKDQRIAELEDALKDRERRLADLKEERDQQADLIARTREQLEECGAQIDRWIEAFNMVPDDSGVWCWREGLIHDRDKWFNKYEEIRAKWNRFVPRYNSTIAPRNMGRPLHASPAQQQRVLTKHAAGQSLRAIAEEMALGVQTVRTIVDKKDGLDRATVSRLQRIAPDRLAEARTRRSSKEIAALPKRINANLKRNAELLKEAKGLK